MAEILCSTGALIGRPNGRDYRLLGPLSEKLSCDGFEFMMYSTWYEEREAIIAFLQENHIYTPVLHAEKGIGEYISKGTSEDLEETWRRFALNCDMAKRIGAKKLVVHLWNGNTSDQNFENNLRGYARLREIADGYGLDLLVENVVCNKENPMKHWAELATQYPDIHFIFDTKMAAFHGQEKLLGDVAYQWLWKENHLKHFHINDYAGGYMDWSNLATLPVGAGHIDFTSFFRMIKENGYHGTFTVEATAFDTDGVVDTDMLNECFQKIRGYLA